MNTKNKTKIMKQMKIKRNSKIKNIIKIMI